MSSNERKKRDAFVRGVRGRGLCLAIVTHGWQDAALRDLFSRLQEREGVMVPYVLETTVRGVRPSPKMIIESLVVNPKLDDTLFMPPNPSAK